MMNQSNRNEKIRDDAHQEQEVEEAPNNEGHLIDIIGGSSVLIIVLIIMIGFLWMGGLRGGRYVLSIFIFGALVLIFGYIKLINKK